VGFLLKLWRGEVSLGTTYWIFGALVVFMFEMLELVPMENASQSDVLTFISSAYYFFISIAIFRSSFRHKGSRLFIIYTQLTAVGLLLVVGWRFFAGSGAMEGIAS